VPTEAGPLLTRNSDAASAEPGDLDVAICTYNNAASLARTLEALGRQCSSPCGWTVLVVDNNSTDGTRETVERHARAARIPGLRLVAERRQGLMHARRRAVLETQAPVIAFVDDDCVLDQNWVAAAVSAMRARPRAGAVGGQVRLIWELEPEAWLLKHAESFAEQIRGPIPLQLPDSGLTYLVGAGLVIRREALLASGWMERGELVDRRGGRLGAGGDTELVLHIRKAGYELWYEPALVLSHHIPARRMSLRHVCGLNRGFGRSYPTFERLIQKAECRTPSAASILRHAQDVGRLLLNVVRPLQHSSGSRRDAAIELSWAVGRVEGELGLLMSRYLR
jgi:GT2 family glycosyltransferase